MNFSMSYLIKNWLNLTTIWNLYHYHIPEKLRILCYVNSKGKAVPCLTTYHAMMRWGKQRYSSTNS